MELFMTMKRGKTGWPQINKAKELGFPFYNIPLPFSSDFSAFFPSHKFDKDKTS